jgi:lipoprotein-releasing system ATP-binding protein
MFDVQNRNTNFELRVSNLSKAFQATNGDAIEVCRGISFSVSPGEAVAITGASGAGKSTLLHLLGGLEAADAGTIQLGDRDISSASTRELSRLLKHEIAFVFQSGYLLSDLTAVENVALPLMVARAGRDQSMRAATEALERIGLGQRLEQRIGLLSGGEQQRVAVARALITKPKLVLADEPTGNLDAAVGDEIGDLLVSYCHAEQAVVLIATHNERLAGLCDRVLRLKDSKLLAE